MKKKIIIPVVTIVVLACLGFGGYKIVNSSNKEPKKKVENTAEKTEPEAEPTITEEVTGDSLATANEENPSSEETTSDLNNSTPIVDPETGTTIGTMDTNFEVPEGTATTWDEYKQKLDSHTVTIEDMKQLMNGTIVRYNEDGSVKRHEDGTADTSWFTELKDENGFSYWLLDDGTEVHPGERDPVSGMILGGESGYMDPNLTEEEKAALDELVELGIADRE